MREQAETVKAGHRFGNVFLRLVYKPTRSFIWHRSVMAKLTPEEAIELGHELLDLASRAKKEKPAKRLKLVR